MIERIEQGMYPIYAIKDNGNARAMTRNGQYLVIFDFREIGKDKRRNPYFQNSTALVRTLPVYNAKIIRGIKTLYHPNNLLNLEGENNPLIHLIEGDSPWNLDLSDVSKFLKPHERIFPNKPREKAEIGKHENIEFIWKEDINQYDPDDKFRHWKLNYDLLPLEDLTALAHEFGGGRK